MKLISETHFGRMETMCSYFAQNSKSDVAYLPLFKASKKINNLIRLTENPTGETFQKIVAIIHEAESQAHFDGMEWRDYKLHLGGILRKNGANIVI